MFSLRQVAWCGVMVSLLFTVTAGRAAPEKPAKSPYRHLVFVRNGGAKPDSLMLGTLGAKGMTERKLHEGFNLGLDLRFFGAVQGRLYATKIHDLLVIDTRNGRLMQLATGVEAHDSAEGKLFWIDGKGAIREYDVRQGKARRVTLGPIRQSYGVQLAASPDGRLLALFVPTNEIAFGPAQLTVVRVADGKTERVGEPIEFHDPFEMAASTFSVRVPFFWLDSQRVTYIRTESGGAAWDQPSRWLMRADVVTGKVKEVSGLKALPEKTMVGLENMPTRRFVARTFDGRQHYVIDPRTGKLTEGDSIGGDFRVREVHSGRDTSWQLYYGKTRLSDAIAPRSPSVSPDGRQAVWVEYGGEQKLRHFDTTTGKTRTLAPGWFGDTFLWLTDRDLAAR